MPKAPRNSLEYKSLDDDDSDSESEQYDVHSEQYRRSLFVQMNFVIGIGLLLLASFGLNIFFGVRLHSLGMVDGGSRWAHLKYNVPTPIYFSTEYGPAIGTEAKRDQLWNALDISTGVIAIPDHLAVQGGLPLSHRFPWDQSQGVYMLGAFHQMHCLKQIYGYISAIHKNETPKYSLYHVQHCLDALLQDVYCHADDTPWYELPPAPYDQKYAKYQVRSCKNWDQFLDWTQLYNACYKYENVTDGDGHETMHLIDHYRFCPEDSPFKTTMERYFEQQESS
ncbi:hypothetical protein MMC14_007364 [Varicellaria rhodocarpa]|nr:hypothetical protein [Varicellaria rhodocarpa]